MAADGSNSSGNISADGSDDIDNQKKDPSDIVVTLKRRMTTYPVEFLDPEDEAFAEHMSAIFRGVAAATRKGAIVAKKVAIAKGPATKQAIRAIGENRPLAFARYRTVDPAFVRNDKIRFLTLFFFSFFSPAYSEGAVAGDAMIPRFVYYGAWGLSATAICADIYTKYDHAPEELKNNTAIYWTGTFV